MLHFGTNGIRGRINELTPDFAIKVGRAVGFWAGKRNRNEKEGKYFRPVLVATDYRLTREVYKRALMAGLTSAGMDVIDADVLPSPVIDYFMRTGKYSAGVIITASHNPPEWNGIKVVDSHGVAVSREVGLEIEKFLGEKPVSYKKIGKIARTKSMLAEYFLDVLNYVNWKTINPKLKVVMDPGNGTLCDAIYMYKRFVNIIPINAQPDGNFPGRKSEPTEENVQTLIHTVKESNADLGIAWDGDGDRIILVDEKGNYVLGDKVFALSLLGFGNGRKGPVLTTVSTSRIIEDVAKKHGLKTEYTKVGAPYLSERADKLKQIAMAGEEVGGIVWPEISWGKDGLFTAFKMLELVSKKPLSEWLKEIPVYYNKKVKIECPADKKQKTIERIKAEIEKEYKSEQIKTIDGIRIDFDDGWVIVRPSGTENIIRVFAEAKTKEKTNELSEKFVNKVRNIL